MSKESELVTKLTKKQYTIVTAESCTGGLLSATIVDVSGASEVFPGGFVTYANEAKEQFVGVSHVTLERFGAVSEETAREMAVGCAVRTGADIGLSVTGIAGPDGGTAEQPVGLVYIGCSFRDKVVVERHVFTGDRQTVRSKAVNAALDLAIHCLDHKE